MRPSTIQWRTITEARAVKLLLDPKMREFLSPFLLQPYSAKRIAQHCDISLNAAHHRMGQLERAELIIVEHLEPRAGRTIKHYRATAKGFFVPFTASSSDGLAGFMRAQLIPMYEHFYELLAKAASALIDDVCEVGFRVYDAGGYVSSDFTPQGHSFQILETLLQPDTPAIMVSFMPLKLSEDHAKSLQHEIVALLEKYAVLGGTNSYVIHVGMTPGEMRLE